MLRFRPLTAEPDATARKRIQDAKQQRRRLWMLLLSLGLVIATMRQLSKPSTAVRLGEFFSATELTTQTSSEHHVVLGADQPPRPTAGVDEPEPADKTASPTASAIILPSTAISSDNDDLNAMSLVKDNTYFRPSESKAWFGLFERLRQLDDQQLSEISVGELTYAQLLKQPDFYRGKVATVRGTLRREEVESAPHNDLGIERYHRLVIQPEGGGHWPIMAYCLELPDELPRGDDLQTPVTVTGYFFKNWSYAWQDGLGIAPVILARNVQWQASQVQKISRSYSSQSIASAFAAACGFALVVVFLVVRNTRRPRRLAGSPPTIALPEQTAATATIHEQLQRLAETEPRE